MDFRFNTASLLQKSAFSVQFPKAAACKPSPGQTCLHPIGAPLSCGGSASPISTFVRSSGSLLLGQAHRKVSSALEPSRIKCCSPPLRPSSVTPSSSTPRILLYPVFLYSLFPFITFVASAVYIPSFLPIYSPQPTLLPTHGLHRSPHSFEACNALSCFLVGQVLPRRHAPQLIHCGCLPGP